MRRTLATVTACVLAAAGALSGAAIATAHAPGARAHAAKRHRSTAHTSGRWMNINEVGHLHRVGKGNTGFKLNEKGYATGTIRGAIYIHLRVTSVNKASIQVNVYPHGGFLGGYAVASYYARGSVAHFSGAMRINGGSGTFKGASGSNLRFSGTIQRTNDNTTVTLSGRIHT